MSSSRQLSRSLSRSISRQISGGLVPAITDADAKAYTESRGLSQSQGARLSGFLTDIKAAGFDPDWVSLGNSEWNALDGSTHHSVIGPDGSLTGSFSEGQDGLVFAGGSESFEFTNPAQSSSLESLAMFTVMATDSDAIDACAISGRYGNTKGVDWGPSLNLGRAITGATNPPNRMGVDGTSVTDNVNYGDGFTRSLFAGKHRLNAFCWSKNGTRPLYRYDTAASRPLWMLSGARISPTGPDPLENLWNNTPNLRLGARGNGADKLAGKYSFGMITSQDVTSSMYMALLEALLKYNIAPVPNDTLIAAVGDSMTEGITLTSPIDARSDQMISQSSNWQASVCVEVALGGQGIAVQETFYSTAKARLLLAPSWNRYVMFWGGYNIGQSDFQDDTARNAIVQRYLDMAEDAAENGISSIHWSRIISYDGDATTTQEIDDNNDWNTAYENGLASIRSSYPDVNVIWYDHRDNYPTQFDGDTRTSSNFVDHIHMSASGQQTLVADFLSTYPNP